MKEFTGLKINGVYELKDGGLQAKTDINISNVTPVELMGILSAVVTNVLEGADEKNKDLLLETFPSVFEKFVKESEKGTDNE